MKSKKVIVLLALIGALFFFTSDIMAAGKGEASFASKIHKFGNIKENGGPVTCEFEFVNTGESNLVVVDATASCGCTLPEYPAKPIAPGKNGVIKVTYNPIGRPGPFDKVITVRTNGKQSKIRLKISGTVLPEK